MKTLLLTGATGMVGTHVLSQLITHSEVGKILSIGRRKTGKTSPKLTEIIHDNFLDFTSLQSELTGIDVCIYCLGVYQNTVSNEQYVQITCDYQQALIDVLVQTSPQLTFVLFGASGADPSEKSRILFARTKGKAENILDAAPFPRKYILRPGYIHPTGERKPPGFAYKIMIPIGGALLTVFPNLGLTDQQLAEGLVRMGMNPDQESRVFENKDIRELVG